jgi:hypothetical protein
MRKLGVLRSARTRVLMGGWAVAAVVALVLTGGCGAGDAKAAAEQVAGQYYGCLQGRDWEGAMDLCRPEFYQAVGRDKAIEFLEKVNGKLGDLQRHDLVGWRLNKRVGTGAGTYVELSYQTTYARYPGQEVIVLYKEPGTEEFKVLSHNVNSEGLVLE